jgi:hypothetical protein
MVVTMMLKLIPVILMALIANGCYPENKKSLELPSQPDWHTSKNDCSWRWVQGGGFGLWSEICHLSTGRWSIVWDEIQHGFILQHQNQNVDLVVQPWKISPDTGISSLSKSLSEAGYLASNNDCQWESVPIRKSPRTMSFYVLRSSRPDALAPTAHGEVPDELCGPYGQSTHGVRYFIVDLRWPDLAIFVNEGQERPIFDPTSITVLH